MNFGRFAVAFFGCMLMSCFALSDRSTGAVDGWQWYEDPVWGYRVEYPAYLFRQSTPTDGQGNITLESPDGNVRLLFFAEPNRLRLDSEGVAEELAHIAGRVVTYRRVAEDWVVLSGYGAAGTGSTPDTIFYERIKLNPDQSGMAGFRLEYPTVRRQEIDPLVGRIGRSLTAPRQAAATLGGAVVSSPESSTDPPVLAPDDSDFPDPSLSDQSRAGVDAHIAWCRGKYPSYDPQTDTFMRFDGVRAPCIDPAADQSTSVGEPSPLEQLPGGGEVVSSSASSVRLTPEEVNAAEYAGDGLPEGFSALALKLQILLDQLGMSPGVIDGVNGRNVAKAIAAAEVLTGQAVDGILDEEVWKRLPRDTPILVDYEITAEDLAGPFLPEVPADFAEMAQLDRISYTGPLEMLGERFHMDVDLLKSLNPRADFNGAGTHIVVAGAYAYAVTNPVATLVADKINAQLRGYATDGRLVVAYPATIGSDELPSPSGTHFVNAIANEAAYYYNPNNFKQGANVEKLTIPPGPNNPIGTTWIDLTEPTYGIHGTPEPSKIDKTRSHGCVRLTNWDVEELATLVRKGVPVEFQ